MNYWKKITIGFRRKKKIKDWQVQFYFKFHNVKWKAGKKNT